MGHDRRIKRNKIKKKPDLEFEDLFDENDVAESRTMVLDMHALTIGQITKYSDKVIELSKKLDNSSLSEEKKDDHTKILFDIMETLEKATILVNDNKMKIDNFTEAVDILKYEPILGSYGEINKSLLDVQAPQITNIEKDL